MPVLLDVLYKLVEAVVGDLLKHQCSEIAGINTHMHMKYPIQEPIIINTLSSLTLQGNGTFCPKTLLSCQARTLSKKKKKTIGNIDC